MIAGTMMDYYFCDDVLVADDILFVTSDRRNGMAALALIRGLQKWAMEKGAQELCLSVSSNVNQDTTGAFFERLGFVRMGGVFKKRLKGE